MKKVITLIFLLAYLTNTVGALSTTMEDAYLSHETVITKFSQDIIGSLDLSHIKILKGENIEIPFVGDIKKLEDGYYLWFNAPSSSGRYRLEARDVQYMDSGIPVIGDYVKWFNVSTEKVDYSINPGVIFSSGNFSVIATFYGEFETTIDVDFPETRTISLIPGDNILYFDTSKIVGTKSLTVNIGRYSLPAYILGGDFFCGDEIIDSIETCDGNNLNGKNCENLSNGFIGGELKCSSDCLSFDSSLCESKVTEIKNNLTKNDSKVPNSSNFSISPKGIEKTILVNDTGPLTLYFKIFNLGNNVLDDIQFDLDHSIFDINPNGNITINPGEYLNVSLKFKEVPRDIFKDAIIVRSGNFSFPFFVRILLTTNETSVGEIISENDSDITKGYYCSELSGSFCSSEEKCSSEEISAIDGLCCTATCEPVSSGNSYIGYILGTIVIIVLAIVIVKYKKTGKKPKGSPVRRSATLIEKRKF